MAGDQTYHIEVWDPDEFFAILETFPRSQQDRVTDFMANHLAVRPKVMIPGQLKELKGKWSGVYQLECGRGRRLLYEVDERGKKARILYLGDHPEWQKRRPIARGGQ